MNQPVKSVGALIKDNFKAMASVLPKHMTAERMARIALIETRKNARLSQADPASLIGAIMVASQLGLEPGVQGMSYLVPYWNSKRECYEVQLQVGYKGMMELAWRSNRVGSIYPETVRDGDTFSYQYGTDPKIIHVPGSGDRGGITHFYCSAKLVPSGHPQFKVMELAQVEKIRDQHSKSGKDKAQGFVPWRDHFEAMGLKTVIRRTCKYLPASPEFLTAIALDEMADAGVAQNLGAHLPSEMELPADFASENAAEKTAGTAEQIKQDLAKAEEEPPHPAETEPSEEPESKPDAYENLGEGALNGIIKTALEKTPSGGIKNALKAALNSDDLDKKRAIVRKVH